MDSDESSQLQSQFSSYSVRNTVKRCAILVTIFLLGVFGVMVLIGVYHVLRRTPQEKLAQQHSEQKDGPFPLRALRFDSRRGVIDDIDAADGQVKSQSSISASSALGASSASTERVGASNGEPEQKVNANSVVAAPSTATPKQFVLLLHGLKSTADQWLPFVDAFLRQHVYDCVFIAPDLLGHGKSPWPDARKTPHNVARHVACIDRLLSRLVPRNASLHIVGHSLGAMLALEYAAHLCRRHVRSSKESAQWRLCSLTLMSTPFFRSAQEAESAAARHYSFWFRHKWLAHAMCGYLFCRQHWLWGPTLQRQFNKRYPNLPPSMFTAAMQHSHDGIFSCAERCVLHHRGYKAAKAVRESGVPVLLVDGANDKLCDGTQQHLAEQLGSFVQRVTLPSAGHGFIVKQVDDAVMHVRPFIEAAANMSLPIDT